MTQDRHAANLYKELRQVQQHKVPTRHLRQCQPRFLNNDMLSLATSSMSHDSLSVPADVTLVDSLFSIPLTINLELRRLPSVHRLDERQSVSRLVIRSDASALT